MDTERMPLINQTFLSQAMTIGAILLALLSGYCEASSISDRSLMAQRRLIAERMRPVETVSIFTYHVKINLK